MICSVKSLLPATYLYLLVNRAECQQDGNAPVPVLFCRSGCIRGRSLQAFNLPLLLLNGADHGRYEAIVVDRKRAVWGQLGRAHPVHEVREYFLDILREDTELRLPAARQIAPHEADGLEL